MRQLKTFMKKCREEMLSCGDCQCETLQCRRDSDKNCGCGGEGGGGSGKITELISFPTDVSLSEGTVSTYSFRIAPIKHYDDVSSQITFVDPYNLIEAYIYSRNDNGDARVNFNAPMGRTGSTQLQVYLNGKHYMDTLVQVTPYIYVDSIYNLPNTIDVYTGGNNGGNYEALQFKFSPTNANNPLGEIDFESYDGEYIGFLNPARANFDGDIRYNFTPEIGDKSVGQTYNYKAKIRGEYTGQDIGLRLIKGIIPTENYYMELMYVERGTVNNQNRIEITDNITDPEELNSVRFEYDPNIVNISCNTQQDGGRVLLRINVEGVGLGNTYISVIFVTGLSFTFYAEVTPNTEDNIINRFDNTSVFQSLSTEAQEEANEKAREIIEEAGDDIMPFYEAMQEGRTFAYYAEQMGLTPDTSGDCGSSVYTDDEAFIIYIGTAGAVSCEYLALVARRGLTPHAELINKQMISDYLDWVTEEGETCTYQFKDWDGEILKFGSVNVGGIPEAPDNPERSGYVFTGWDPEIQQISEDVIFTAQYTEEPSVTPLALESADNNNTISFQAYNNPDTTIPLDYNINGTGWQPVNWSNPQWTLNLSDTIMFRSRSTETTGFNFMSDDREQTQNYWVLTSNGPWRCSGDITTLINKNGTDTLTTNNVFANLFGRMPHLLSAPTLPAINLTEGCYAGMFAGCGDLVELPTLPATTLPNRCYSSMFSMCWGIRLSETETGEYQYPFRIPASGEGTSTSSSTRNMLSETGGTYNPYHTSTPINTTYYCANSKFIWGTYYLQALDTENLIVGEPNGPHFQIICHTDEDWVDVVSSSGEMALQNLGTYCRGGSWRDKGTQWVVQEITKIYNLQQQHGIPNLEMRDDIFDAMVDFCIYNPYDKTGNNEYLMYLQGLVAQGDWYKTYPEENLR